MDLKKKKVRTAITQPEKASKIEHFCAKESHQLNQSLFNWREITFPIIHIDYAHLPKYQGNQVPVHEQ